MAATEYYLSAKPWSDLFTVSPQEFNITCQLNKDEFLQLCITNQCNSPIAWKLKTNRPGRYMVSPKQGIIKGNERTECTVVLTKFKELPDLHKSDKFLIQATKVAVDTNEAQLNDIWKDRESKHDKKRSQFAYHALTIKCHIKMDKRSIEEAPQSAADQKKVNFIDDYVEVASPSKSPSKAAIDKQPTEIATQSPQKPPPSASLATASAAINQQNENETDNAVNTVDAEETVATKQGPPISSTVTASKPTPTPPTDSGNNNNTPSFNQKTVEQWRRKAQEYDELFQFTRKTLAQRDELKNLWQKEQKKADDLERRNRALQDEKEHIMSEYNKYRNDIKMDKGDADSTEDEEEKEMKEEQGKDAVIRQMEEIDKAAERESKAGFSISIAYIVGTLLLMYAAFYGGSMYAERNVSIAPCEQVETPEMDPVDDIIDIEILADEHDEQDAAPNLTELLEEEGYKQDIEMAEDNKQEM